MLKTILIAITTLVAGIALTYSFYQATGYREIHIADCATAEPLVLASGSMAGRLDAFVWGYSSGPVELDVSMGEAEVENTVLVPDENRYVQWSYHGDWYDDFVVQISGEGCKMNITYRL